MNVILISGKSGNGKDALGSCFEVELKARGYKVLTIHYADFLKFFCQRYLGWNGQKDVVVGRPLLQNTGTAFRNAYADTWVDIMAAFLRGASEMFDYVLIPDVRYHNEIDGPVNLKAEGWIDRLEVIRVERPGFDNGMTDEQKRHSSETALDDYEFKSYYLNIGDLDTMKANAKEWVDEITKS